MLPTFVIGLREGLEATLIIGIIAAFLAKHGRRAALRQVWIGTGAAVLICVGIAIALQVISADLPERQQEGLETVIGLVAVAMVTLHGAVHAAELPGHEGRAGEVRGGRADGRFRRRAGPHGVPGRAAGGRGNVGLPAGHVQRRGRRDASWSGALIGILVAAGSATPSTAAACGSTWPASSGSPGWSWWWSRPGC